MHNSQIGLAPESADLLDFLGALASPEQRQKAASALARLLGGESLLLFAPDPELGAVLPAPGLSQVLKGAAEWRRVLDACTREGAFEGSVPGPDGQPVPARGCALPDGTAAVLLGTRPGSTGPEPLRPLLPLLAALFGAERRIGADRVRARGAADAIQRAQVLTRALQDMRQRLEGALIVADEARVEARERAEQAEALADELQSQAELLQNQAMELELLNVELTARTEEAERARAVADEANRAKSQFLANMSHELRTPINAVIGYAELLNLGITGPITPQQQAQLERIQASSAHLLSLVNDVLDLAKVEAGRLAIGHDREQVAAVLMEAAHLIETQAAAQQISLRTECGEESATYVGDRYRVRQILVNLLSNAVKFTGSGGSVTLRCGTVEEASESAQVTGAGPWTYIAVEDTGIGIGPDELPRIFQPFVQAEAGHTRKHGGTGLGLTISRQLARLMGGDLTVHSEKGKGSCFTLWLPAESSETGQLDTTIRVGSEPAVESFPSGLDKAGATLRTELPAMTEAFVRRLRAELPADALEGMDDSEILDSALVMIADVARVLTRLGRVGGDPALLRDGSHVQRSIAEEHGADRGRRGWSVQALRREFEILREEIIAAVRAAAERSPDVDERGTLEVVDRLLDAARRASLRSHGAAMGAAISGERVRF